MEKRKDKEKQRNGKFRKWIQTAAGKVSILLILISTIMLLVVLCDFTSKVGIDVKTANNINNILVGLATNFIGIIVTVSFVQYFIDKQNKEEERKEEVEKILRYNKIMKLLIARYTLFFQCVTSPIEKRTTIALSKDLMREFSFSDMADLYKFSGVLTVELLKPSIELFYEAEQALRNYMVEMIKNIDFKHNGKIESVLIEFIRQSQEMDVSGVIINNQKIFAGNKKQSEEVSQYIKDDLQHKWVDRYMQGNLSANLMHPYVTLYLMLKIEGRILTEYQQLIDALLKS